MPEPRADALVLFGITGDLAYQQIFPALQAMARHGQLDIPVIGVARPDWTADRLWRFITAIAAANDRDPAVQLTHVLLLLGNGSGALRNQTSSKRTLVPNRQNVWISTRS